MLDIELVADFFLKDHQPPSQFPYLAEIGRVIGKVVHFQGVGP